MRNELQIGKEIQLKLSLLGHRIFRHNVGVGWIGESVYFKNKQTIIVYPGDVVIRKARTFHAGLIKGGSDLIGWTKNGRFLAVETKTDRNKIPSVEQINFITAVNRAGGCAFVATSASEAIEKINC